MPNLFLDIRTQKEYCTGHICGAVLIETPLPPVSAKQKQKMRRQIEQALADWNRRGRIFVYCKKGIRSSVAKSIIRDLRYDATNLGGVEHPFLKNVFMGTSNYFTPCYCNI